MVTAWCFKKFTSTQCRTNNCQFGGARRDRTADLLNAIQALSQLSYGPDRMTEDAGQTEDRRRAARAG